MKLSLLSKYRTHIMGAAMMWIMWFHSPFYGKTEVFHFIHNIGFYGVDIFLMVSGLGLYYSMRKSKGVGDFYRKRAVRILPAYLIITIAWYAFFKTDVAFSDKVLSILGINYFRGSIFSRPEYFDWFLPTLFVLYLITPWYDKLFRKVTAKWKLTLLVSMISPLLCIIGYAAHIQVLYGSFVRIPIFLIGYNIGYFLYEKKEEEKGSWMVHLALLFTGLVLGYYIQTYVKNTTVFWGINAYPATLVAPAAGVFLAALFKVAEDKLRIVGKIILFPFEFCGNYSLEIYLIHQRLMEIMNADFAASLRGTLMGSLTGRWYYFLLGIVSILMAALLHELIAFVTNLIRKAAGGKKAEKATP